jgi:alanyl-tRNA synthetase
VVARVDQLSPGELRDLAIAVRQQPGVRIAILGGETDSGGASLVAAVRPDTGLQASELIREAAKAVKGGGGGKGDIATAGGKDPSGLDDALGLARARATSLAIG